MALCHEFGNNPNTYIQVQTTFQKLERKHAECIITKCMKIFQLWFWTLDNITDIKFILEAAKLQLNFKHKNMKMISNGSHSFSKDINNLGYF